MIPRYARETMTAIWSPETKYRIWFEIEAHAADAMAELGVIPKEAARAIWEKGRTAKFDPERIDEIEREVKHDVIAFLTHLAEFVGPEARFVHQGMTSSDVLDTTLAVQLSRASDILLADIDALLAALKTRAYQYKLTPTIGRSHGIHAEPTTFGVKLAGYYAEFQRARARLVNAQREIATSLERLATEIRHLQRTEIGEVEEYFSEGQKGSSAMPHKRNPVLSENLVGLSRMVRAYAMPALENVALWHERDISHSSVERYIAPDATVTLDFAMARAASLIEKLAIYPERIKANLDRTQGLVHSGRVLLALTQKGMAREEAYALVQDQAMRTWRGEGALLDLLKADPRVTQLLKPPELAELFDLDYHLKEVDTIFARVFG